MVVLDQGAFTEEGGVVPDRCVYDLRVYIPQRVVGDEFHGRSLYLLSLSPAERTVL